jgi:hypothetical protein
VGRNRRNDESGIELLFGIVAKAWRSPPHVGALMGVGLGLVFCVAVPAALSLAVPTQVGPPSVANMAAGAIAPMMAMFSNGSTWLGIGTAAACFGCAAINLMRGHRGSVGQGGRLHLVPKSGGRNGNKFSRIEPKVAPTIPFVRRHLLTPTELIFFKRLRQAFPDVLVCPQVALAAIVDIPAQYNHNRFKHVNRAPFSAKYADFAIVDPDTGEVHAIIELDDYSHDAAERQAEDAVRDAMLGEVGIPVHRFDARKMPDAAALHAWLEAD